MPDSTLPDLAPHAARRARLADWLGDGVAVIATAPEAARNRDTHYPYRFDSYFYHLTGFVEPEAVLVVVGGANPRAILFCRDKDETREIWDGFRYGPTAAQIAFGFDEAYSIAELDARLPELLGNRARLAWAIGDNPAWDTRMVGWLNAVRARARQGVAAPVELLDVRACLDELRLVKDAHELDVMRRSAAIATEAHRRAMRATRPGRREYEVEAELLHTFYAGGAQAPAYTSIVAGGGNACVLHYVTNRDALRDGDLLLIDAGCELDGYASDITRTFPVSGKFSAAQKDAYEVVLAAQATAIAAVRPGAPWIAPHDAAVRVLTQGMVDLGLLKGEVDGLIESNAYSRFYMHRTSHWLGLDVHDAGEYKRDGDWRGLVPGNVLTVEPGLYIRPADDVPAAFHNIGIRIEDDVAVTANGCEVMTSPPKTVAEIEAWMQG
ncbi:MAG: Xaa-Pro aminopeptidase [Hydrogenophilales bacterium 16-64-46]|nr:MAG: Xaa-Pro aminopeptidase [Hydrogenophilales bacterium 12-64-13]OYZ07137.1 MAG: Xaa-Pro aminopeptidase [Hydrogenophilales bacterium 16-64-46]OZA37394.1 MAG: Xaa-Pro aminopeptidase [Hydrogenophilales bacterium 17-64-34]HQT00586.1 aminopeptidase P N-terminal domain-containing protein [Thiobacillus sp.]